MDNIYTYPDEAFVPFYWKKTDSPSELLFFSYPNPTIAKKIFSQMRNIKVLKVLAPPPNTETKLPDERDIIGLMKKIAAYPGNITVIRLSRAYDLFCHGRLNHLFGVNKLADSLVELDIAFPDPYASELGLDNFDLGRRFAKCLPYWRSLLKLRIAALRQWDFWEVDKSILNIGLFGMPPRIKHLSLILFGEPYLHFYILVHKFFLFKDLTSFEGTQAPEFMTQAVATAFEKNSDHIMVWDSFGFVGFEADMKALMAEPWRLIKFP